MKHALITVIIIACATPAAIAQPDTLAVLDRAVREAQLSRTLLSLAWDNAAVKQLERDYALSEVSAQWQLRHEDEALRTQVGNRENAWTLQAQSYMKHHTATLWGHAGYRNGRSHGALWNETSDLDVTHPYVLADSVGGTAMKQERYDFGGGYADRRGAWLYGGSIGYTAGLYYRSSDPRPRNVTADLHLQLGGGRVVGDRYAAALGFNFKKYKQTNEVTFYSEMGNDKLFHLTGLSNDYGRFAGTAYNTYYKGYRYSAIAGLHTRRARGLSLTVEGSRMTVDNVLTAFNKLPMARIAHNQVDAEAAWLSERWAVRAAFNASRRVGTENIFGDPAATVYPKIGALDMYHENRLYAAVTGLWQTAAVGVQPMVAYRHLNVIYADPQCRELVNDMTLGLKLRGSLRAGRTLAVGTVGATHTMVTDDALMLNSVRGELTGLQRAIERDHDTMSHAATQLHAAVAVTVAVNSRHALRAAVDYAYGSYAHHNHTHNVTTSLSYVF